MSNKHYVGEIGLTFEIDVDIDLTTAETTNLLIKKPDGSMATWEGTIKEPATGGIITYTTVEGDLDSAGRYALQAYVELSSGGKYYGDTANFMVYDQYQ